jgi:uracil-DNA glycosylase family 4
VSVTLPIYPTASQVGCSRCPGLLGRTQIVDGAGPDRPLLLVVGEAPGADEDLAGVPFVGRSGQLLRSSLGALGLSNDQIRFTNAVRCRPPENRDPSADEQIACQQWLGWEIAQAQPRVILALGKIAANVLGMFYDEPATIYQAWHPAYVLRAPKQRQKWLQQLAPAVTHALTGAPPRKAAVTPDPWYEAPVVPGGFWTAVDTETDDLEEGIGVKLVSWQRSDGHFAEMFDAQTPFPNVGPEWGPQHTWAHNIKYDAPLLGLDLRNLDSWDDTALVAYVLRYERVGLKALGPELTGLQMAPIKELLQRKEPRLLKSGRQATLKGEPAWKTVKQSFSEALQHEPDRARTYAMLDAVVTSRLARILWPQLQAEPTLLTYYQELEKPVVPILTETEQRGVQIDPDKLVVLGAEISKRVGQYEQMARLTLGVDDEFNLGSNDQLAHALAHVGLPLTHRTATGRLSVDEQALLSAVGATTEQHCEELLDAAGEDHRLRLQVALVRDILKVRELKKLQSTYVDALLNGKDAQNRIHGRFNQMVTNTNRLSSSGPNLQNIPARDPLGKTIREAFIAKPGHVLVKADYSQLEVRIYAALSGEKVLVDAYPASGEERDCHQSVADALGIPRKRAKNVLFATLYGASAPKLAATAGVPGPEAGAFLARMRESMPTLLTWQNRQAQEITQKGYIETLLGWRGYFPTFFSPIDRDRNEAMREMANFPIQGAAAGIVKRLMIEADARAHICHAELVLQVHDEVVYEVPERLATIWAKELETLGAEVGRQYLSVPLKLNVEIGPSWGQVRDWRDWLADSSTHL